MRFLVDTQALLWWFSDNARLGPEARRSMLGGEPIVSAVSLWEVAIKVGLGKLEADVTEMCRDVTAQLFERLALVDRHMTTYQTLPLHHRDPFDRMLVAQSLSEDVPLLTADRALSRYDCRMIDATD